MIAYDASANADKVLASVIDNAQFLKGLTCHLVMVNKHTHQEALATAKKSLQDAEIKVVDSLLEGDVESVLSDYAAQHNIDLLIMGAFGHSKLRQFFVGSTTLHMLHRTKIPLLLVH